MKCNPSAFFFTATLALALVLNACMFDPSGLKALQESDANNNQLPDASLVDTDDMIDDVPDAWDGDIDADADSGLPPCTAADNRCEDDYTLLACTTSGELVPIPCELGCNSQVFPVACTGFIPSNDVPAHLAMDPLLQNLNIQEDAWLDTDTGEIRTFTDMPLRAEGTGLLNGILFLEHILPDESPAGLFVLDQFRVSAGVILEIRGSRPLILYADSIFLLGVVDVSARDSNCSHGNNRCPGPGGFEGGSANNHGNGPGGGRKGQEHWSLDPETGGGGGGFLTAGGKGGGNDGGNGGSVYGSEILVPLTGGSGGGGGGHISGTTDTTQGRGGGGGGAVQLSARNLFQVGNQDFLPCGVKASGNGGRGNDSAANSGGGGGGSGGAILLEATRLHIFSGALFTTNGGGGGAGRSDTSGSAGLFSMEPAPGAHCNCNVGGTGGAHLGPLPGQGSNSKGDDGTGGGGGAMGRIVIRDCLDFQNHGEFSPQPLLAGCLAP